MRPVLHFTAETGWINDPHGMAFHNGEYHLFHQYVPDSLVWAPNCHWGHATSPDLCTGHDTAAIAPGDGDDGIWTGSLVQDGEETRIFYTSVVQPNLGLGRVRLATPDDDNWETWTKGDIVVRPPKDLDLIAFRDPFVIREEDEWRMFVGAATRDGDALALTYTSDDLTTWDYDGVAVPAPRTSPSGLDGRALGVPADLRGRRTLGHGELGLGRRRPALCQLWHRRCRLLSRRPLLAADWGQLSFGRSYYARHSSATLAGDRA